MKRAKERYKKLKRGRGYDKERTATKRKECIGMMRYEREE